MERVIGKVVKSFGIKEMNTHFQSTQMKYMEGCVEAPLQISLQIYILVAGQWPGNHKLLSNHQNLIC